MHARKLVVRYDDRASESNVGAELGVKVELTDEGANRSRRSAARFEGTVIKHRPDFDEAVQAQRPRIALQQDLPRELRRAPLLNAFKGSCGQIERAGHVVERHVSLFCVAQTSHEDFNEAPQAGIANQLPDYGP